jgi:4-aminobutyrate aminotransferase-like enzyme
MTLSLSQSRSVTGEPGFLIKSALGAHVWDHRGRRYIDLTSGWNVVNAGWNNPEILEAWRKCSDTLPFRPSWCADDYGAMLVEMLSDLCHGYIPIAGCSGADAIDNALKVARLVTGRPGVISFAGTYHGSSTGAALAMGYDVPHLEVLGVAERHVSLPLGGSDDDLSTADLIVRSAECAGAIVVETILTNAGCLAPSEQYFAMLRELADELGLLLVCDEIGTGFGRTGAMLSHGCVLRPDIVVLGKALTNGLYPLSLCMVSKDLVGYLNWESFASTFAGAPLGCAAAVASMAYITRHDLASRAASNGATIRQRLLRNVSSSKLVSAVHGRGLELAVHFDWALCNAVGLTPHELIRCLRERETFATLSADSHLMIMPPLIAEIEDLLSAMDAIGDVVHTFD